MFCRRAISLLLARGWSLEFNQAKMRQAPRLPKELSSKGEYSLEGLGPVWGIEEKALGARDNLLSQIPLQPFMITCTLQSNLSTTATLGTELTGHCEEVTIVRRLK